MALTPSIDEIAFENVTISVNILAPTMLDAFPKCSRVLSAIGVRILDQTIFTIKFSVFERANVSDLI